ncbi:hypothetical protein V8F44DRAFT_654859 [Aspergillus fumigatus]|uniref:Uncharacterized protein n=1 Tax=Aspergillus fumigatus (strain CBS 144.89 / FGSC A1163 / CEA10) TaxID=451804 RepID=B0Y3K0_ASPFC|nr:conserved hypothetical protein [Aspergillus fumigatus A1163]
MEDEKKPTVAECQVLESSNNHQSALQGISTRLSEGSAKCFIQNEERSTGSQYLFVPSQVLDNRLKCPPGGSMVEEFLTCYSPDFIPPRRYELLRRFLERTGARSFPEAIRSFPADKRILAMIDDRCDPCVSVSLPSGARFLPLRQWESDSYMQRPPEGLHIHVYGADAETLHVNLQKDFHLPYYALRPDQPDLRDSRGLRKHRYFRPPGEEKQDRIYEAQVSLVVFGVDDFFWAAYFCEDTYFSDQDLVATCLQDEVDGPSLGRRMHKFPIWDPRYYFLSILATRTGQITLEWTVLVQSLENVLDRHGEIDQENLNTFLEHDPTLKKTKEYTWILCILRRLRNGLAQAIAALIAFDNNNTVYFDLDADGHLQDKFRECFSHVRQHTAELEALRMILEQRIEIMEKMSGVVSSTSRQFDEQFMTHTHGSWSMPPHSQRVSRPLVKATISDFSRISPL